MTAIDDLRSMESSELLWEGVLRGAILELSLSLAALEEKIQEKDEGGPNGN